MRVPSRRIETLAQVPLFQSLGVDEISRLDTQCSWRSVPSQEWIIDYQDQTDDVVFVVKGTVRVKIQSVTGRDVLLREISEGEFFGELAAIDGQPRSSGIVAVTDVVVAHMPKSVFRSAVHSNPDVCDQLLAILAGQIRMLANRVNESSTLDIRHRLYAELLRMARSAPGHGNRMVISPPPFHADMASRVGARREAVSREIKALERSGLIVRRRGALELIDPEAIRKMIESASFE
jgi:CRP/FNR family cyclic AMP-dependent transcriptional regulator